MQLQVTSGGVQAVIMTLLLIGAVNVFVINAIFDRRMRQFIKDLNGTYTRSGGSKVTGREVENKLHEHGREIREIHKYAHDRSHMLANAIQVMQKAEGGD